MSNEPFQKNFEMIPDYDAVTNVLHDITLRVQQTLIALQVYGEKLEATGKDLPGLQVSGYHLKEIPLAWGGIHTPHSMSENLRRSITVAMLNGLNLHIYSLDSFLVSCAKKYYNLHPDEESATWFTEDVFSLSTGIDLKKLSHYEAIQEIRRLTDKLRKMQRTQSLTVPEFFEYFQKLKVFTTEIAIQVSEKVAKDKAEKERKDGQNDSE